MEHIGRRSVAVDDIPDFAPQSVPAKPINLKPVKYCIAKPDDKNPKGLICETIFSNIIDSLRKVSEK